VADRPDRTARRVLLPVPRGNRLVPPGAQGRLESRLRADLPGRPSPGQDARPGAGPGSDRVHPLDVRVLPEEPAGIVPAAPPAVSLQEPRRASLPDSGAVPAGAAAPLAGDGRGARLP